jgi:hypothetical protein
MAHDSDFDRVLLLGDAATDQIATADLSEDINLEEYKVIVWQPANWWTQVSDRSASGLTNWVHKVERRLMALAAWLTAGNDLVVVLDRLAPIAHGRGNVFDFRTVVPLNVVKFQDVTGERVRFSGPAVMDRFSDEWLDVLCYQHVIARETLSPLFTVSTATKRSIQVVGGVIRTKGEGNLILVPPDNSDPRSHARAKYLAALAMLPDLLRQGGSDLPEWVKSFKSQKALEGERTIQKLSRQIADANTQILMLEAEISKDDWLRELYAGSGDGFTNAVASALTELGLKVVEGPNSRADLEPVLN